MTCSDIREYVFAFLDSELDAPLSIELQRHLERCHECAREVEVERAIRRQLGASLEAYSAAPPLDQRTLRRTVERIAAPRGLGVWLSRRWLLAASIAAAILLVPTLWLASRNGSGADSHSRFADLVVSDFEHFLEEGRKLHIESSDRRSVSDWLRDKTALAVVLPTLDSPGGRLLGGRKCKIDGRPAAFAVYEINGEPASMVAITAKPGELAGMKQVTKAGRIHWVDVCKGYRVVACIRGELVYAAVSSLGEEELVSLMADTRHEGD